MIIKKAVIPAAGLGTRFLPITKSMPKEMLPIIDKPVIQYVVEEAISSGIDNIIIVTGKGKRAIEDYFFHGFNSLAEYSSQLAFIYVCIAKVKSLAGCFLHSFDDLRVIVTEDIDAKVAIEVAQYVSI